MSNQRTDEEKLDALIDFLGDSIFEAGDEEMRDEFRVSGIDSDTEVVRLKCMMLETVKSFRQRALRSAREAYNHHIAQMETKHHCIPNTPAERRKLFSFVTQQPQYAQFVTAQYRDLTNLTDSDIESYLEDLAELGVLDNLKRDDSDEE